MLFELIGLPFFQRALLALFFAGAICSIAGVWVLVMKFSFIGMCISHAAFAGALLALFFNLPVLGMAFAFSIAASGMLGPLADRGQLSPDASTGILFSASLGLAFLFLGLLPESRGAALNLLWGSILTITAPDVGVLAAVFAVIAGSAVVFFKEIQSVIFSRELAKASGIHSTLFFYLILFLAGTAAASSLKTVGGLLVFSLMINPAAAAYQITYSLKKMYFLSAFFGILSGWAGLFFSTVFDLPVGAAVILCSCCIFVAATVFSPKKNVRKKTVF